MGLWGVYLHRRLATVVGEDHRNLHAPRAEIAAAKIETETTDAEQRQVERQAVCLKLAGQIHPADVVEIGEAATAQTLGARLDVEKLDEIVGAEIDVVIEGFEDRHLLGLGQEQQPRDRKSKRLNSSH